MVLKQRARKEKSGFLSFCGAGNFAQCFPVLLQITNHTRMQGESPFWVI
jgi:hypothetical protein